MNEVGGLLVITAEILFALLEQQAYVMGQWGYYWSATEVYYAMASKWLLIHLDWRLVQNKTSYWFKSWTRSFTCEIQPIDAWKWKCASRYAQRMHSKCAQPRFNRGKSLIVWVFLHKISLLWHYYLPFLGVQYDICGFKGVTPGDLAHWLARNPQYLLHAPSAGHPGCR